MMCRAFSAAALRAAGRFSARGFAARSAGVGMLLMTALAASAQQPATPDPNPQTSNLLTLQQAVSLAQKQGYQAAAVAATRDAARARDHAFGARLLPQLSLSATAPRYERAINGFPQPGGEQRFIAVQQTTADAALTVSQKVPFTGGTFSVTSRLQRYEQTADSTVRSWSSNPVIVSIEQPLLRVNSLRWDSREQDTRIDVSERLYLEAREAIAQQTTNAFFDFYIAKRTLENATTNAAVNDTLYTLNKGRLEVGKIGENDLLQSELALLRARAAAENAKLDYDRSLSALRLALNLAPDAPLDVAVSSEIPRVQVDTAVAVAQALRNRSQLSDLELQSIQARRRVAEAKFNSGVGAGAVVSASVGFNQTAPEASLAYQNLLQSQRFSLGVTIPLMQWGAHAADMQAALSDQRRVDATSRATRQQIAQDGRFAALQLTQAQHNVELSAKADTVAAKRFEVAYNRYVIGRIGIDNLYIAQNEKDQAVQQYLAALRGYWSAYYRLRQVTLYDFEAGAAIR